MSNQTLFEGFTLSTWRVMPLQGQIISSDGKAVHIAPKAMDVLVCLASRPGEVVERTTIFEEVWGKLAWSDEALTHCVSEIRRAFGDKPGKPGMLLTVPKRGYRLVAPVNGGVTSLSADVDEPPLDPSTGFLARQFRDLRKRKVFQIVFGYPVLAWLLLQIVDIIWQYLLEPLDAPGWIVPSFVVLLALGYPVAVFLAWAVDLTPEGVKLTTGGREKPSVTGLTILGIGSITITVAALFLYFSTQVSSPRTSPRQPVIERSTSPLQKSIAVLRFTNMSNNPELQHISDGLTEELIHELTNLKALKVAARTTVWAISDSRLRASEIAQQLGVERVLEGSIREDGDDIRIMAQLIDRDGYHIWSQGYDRTMDDPMQVQKEIAAKVAADLELVLDDDGRARLARKPTRISAAYDRYLRGRQYLRQPGNPTSLDSAGVLFREAIELDGRFPLAYAGLCEVHLANYRLSRETSEFTSAELACHRALTLDGGLSEVYTALGNLYRLSGQNVKAAQEYELALSINPTMEEATYGLGRVYQAQGRLVEAEESLLRTIELEPAYWGTHFGVANFLFRQGRFIEAIPHYKTVVQMVPEYAGAYINLGSSLMSIGDWDNAKSAFLKSIELRADSMAYQNLGTLYYYSHEFDNAAETHRKAIEISPADHRAWGKLAAAERYVPGQDASSQAAYDKARSLVEAQLDINPDEPEDLMNLAAYQINLGNPELAFESANKAVSLAPTSPSTHYFAAIVHKWTGNNEEAISQLAQATKLGYPLRLLEADPQFEEFAGNDQFDALFSKQAEFRTR